MKSLLTRLLNLGATPATRPIERRFVLLSNVAMWLVPFATMLGGLQPLTRRVPHLSATLLAQGALFLLGPLVMATGRVLAARLYFGVFAIVSIVVVAFITGPDSDQALYLIGASVGVWFVFPPSQQRFAYALSALAGALFVALELWRPASILGVPVERAMALQTQNHVILLVIVVVFVVYSYRRTSEAEEQLEAAHRKSEEILLNVLPASIAERLKENRGSIAERFDAATILFADIVNFTDLAERTPPVELVALLDDVFTRFDALAGRFGLEKIKTIGDAYMVASGIPEPRADHVEAVAEMALEMIAEIQRLPARMQGLNLRIGIHTGPVVAGVIGRRRFAYDLWGDSVNTASRMESHGQPGRIHVSASVYERLRERFVFETRGPIQVKGKGELTTYFLVGRAAGVAPMAIPEKRRSQGAIPVRAR